MTREEIYEEIAALAVRLTGVKRDKLTPQTRLVSDLGLDGDDADAFMQAFKERFAIDMEGFVCLRYFGDEGWNMLTPAVVALARLLSPRFEQSLRAALDAEREITLSHLIECAVAKRWTHPGPEHLPSRKPGRVAAAISLAFVSAATLSILTFTVFGAILIYGMASGAISDVTMITGGTAIVMAGFPLLMLWNAWRNIQRKLASAAVS